MEFILGTIFRQVTIQTRKEIISWLMPKMIFYMSTVTTVTSTAGYYLAAKMGLFTYGTPTVYWISAVVIIVIAMTVRVLEYFCLPIFVSILSSERRNQI